MLCPTKGHICPAICRTQLEAEDENLVVHVGVAATKEMVSKQRSVPIIT